MCAESQRTHSRATLRCIVLSACRRAWTSAQLTEVLFWQSVRCLLPAQARHATSWPSCMHSVALHSPSSVESGTDGRQA
jgi:hypothetical protein